MTCSFCPTKFFSSEITVPVPPMGDSISDGILQAWIKQTGEGVEMDELLTNIETEKVNFEIRAPQAGVLTAQLAQEGDKVDVGQDLYKLDTSKTATTSSKPQQEKPAAPAPAAAAPPPPAAAAPPTPPSAPKPTPTPTPAAPPKPTPAAAPAPAPAQDGLRTERRVPMTRLRARVAERLKTSQNTYALLTTFQEADMSKLMELRSDFKDDFQKKHGVKLGFMSAFVKASAIALMQNPVVNAVLTEGDILYRDYVDISIAVATPKGLVTPVVRNCEKLSFADVEKQIVAYGEKARSGKISLEDLAGGTFTISNGGVYGSLMGTPIVNPPQSAILGMHAINKKPVVVNDQIVVRPVMYLALTYDHRLLDGSDAVTFLKKVKSLIEDPRRILLDL